MGTPLASDKLTASRSNGSGSAALRTGWVGADGGFKRLNQWLEGLGFDRYHRDHRYTQALGEALRVYFDAARAGHVNHVEGDDDGQTDFQDLADEVEIP